MVFELEEVRFPLRCFAVVQPNERNQMKFNKWTLGIAAVVAIVAINASPPASALERDVSLPAVSEVQMSLVSNPATLAPLEVGAIGMEIVAIPITNEESTIGVATTIVTSAAPEENCATWTTTAITIGGRTLVHSPVALVSRRITSNHTYAFQKEGGVASGAWLVVA